MILNPDVTSKNTLKIFPNLEKRFHEVHNKKYDYSKAVYTRASKPITIVCPIHGDFQQTPGSHLDGHECHKCALLKRAVSQRKTKESFIEEASSFYKKDSYSYEKVEMGTSNKHKVTVTCAKHGDFKVIVNNHARGTARCMQCSLEDSSNNKIWAYSDWEKAGLKSKHFDSFKLYAIRCFNDEETFLKIGKTYTTVAHRFRSKSFLPYEYEVLLVKEGSARFISELEQTWHTLYKTEQYIPKQSFGGQYECFNFVDLLNIN